MGVKCVADGKVVIDVILDDGRVAKGVAKVDGRISALGNTAQKSAVSIGKIVSALGLVALARKGIDMVRDSLQSAFSRIDTMEQFNNVMTVMTGSTKIANKALERTNSVVKGTAYGLDVAASAVQNFVTRGVEIDRAVDYVEAWGDAVAFYGDGSNEQLNNVTEALQNMLVKGKVGMDQLQRLFEAGIPAVEIYADAVGMSASDVQEALSDGEISAEKFVNTVTKAMMEGGKKFPAIAGAAKEAGASWGASFDNMRAAVTRGVVSVIQAIDKMLTENGLPDMRQMIADFGMSFEKVLNSIADGIPIVANFIGNLITKFQELTGSTDGIKTSVMNVISTLTDFFAPAFEAVFSFVSSIWAQFVEFFQTHGEMIGQAVDNVMTFIWGVMQFIWPAIEFLVIDTWESIKGVIQGALDVILGIIQFFGALFTGNWTEMWEATKKIFKGALQFVWNLINLWFIGKILKAGKTFAKGFSNIFKALWNGIKSLFSASINAVKNIVQAGFNFIRSIISGIMNAIRSVISSIWSGIKGIFSGSVSGLKSIVSNGFRAMVNAIKSLMDSALSAVKNIFKNMIDAGKNAGKMFVGIGKDLIEGLITGIKNMGKAAIDAITGVVGSVVDKAKSLLKIKSPSRLFMEFGGFISEGMAIGIDDESKNVIKSVSSMIDDMSKEVDVDLLGDLKEFTANKAIGSFVPVTQHIMREVITEKKGSKVQPVKQQPAYITLVLGGREYSAFVRDISETQARTQLTLEAFRG